MITNYLAGGNVDSWCTKCKLELGHTIIAVADNLPVRVKCNTCNGEHNYSTKKTGKGRPKSTTSVRKAKTQESAYHDYLARLADYDVSKAQKYCLNGNFKKNVVIDHHKFGIGIVLTVVQNNKVEILFKDGPKILIQNMEVHV